MIVSIVFLVNFLYYARIGFKMHDMNSNIAHIGTAPSGSRENS